MDQTSRPDDMTSLSDYLEGVMRVPLTLLTSDGFSECPAAFSDSASVSDFKRFLNNRDQPITGIVSPKKLENILEQLVITRQQFQQTLVAQEPLSNSKFKIDCLLGQHCLDKAKALLGQDHECIVRIYSIPPELPGRYGDGEICRQILLLYKEQPSLAQKWLERLSRGKRKHVTMVFHRDGIWNAMKEVAVFPGLWHDIKLGNWAKHLAAHIDKQIETYWKHIYRVWNGVVFNGIDESLRQRLDASSARFLQFKAPGWSEKDQEAIREKMKNGTLFCNISSEEARASLLRNLLAFKGVIPSILTFHENMRYLTVGAKILERYIEVKTPTEKAKPELAPLKTPESLYNNLEQDWGKQFTDQQYRVECEEGLYRPMNIAPNVQGAFVQLMLAALRSFPFLSSETPLQDIKGIGMNAFADDSHRRRLCMTAYSMGFWNEKIQKGLELPDESVQRKMPEYILVQTEQIWRGGLPTISVFTELRTRSFLPNLASAARDATGREPSATLIQYDFICAFFGEFRIDIDHGHPGFNFRGPVFEATYVIPDDSEPMTDAPSLNLTPDIDWVSGAAFTGQPVAAAEQPRSTGPKKTRQKAPTPNGKSQSAIRKNRAPAKMGNPFLNIPNKPFGKTQVPPTPEVINVGDLEVPGTVQRMSIPTLEGGYDALPAGAVPSAGQPQLLQPQLLQPQQTQLLPETSGISPPTEPTATPIADPEVPGFRQRMSAPNMPGIDAQHEQRQQKEGELRQEAELRQQQAERQQAELLQQQGAERQQAELLQQQEAERQQAELLQQQEAERQQAELQKQQQEELQRQQQQQAELLQQQEAERQQAELQKQQQTELRQQQPLELERKQQAHYELQEQRRDEKRKEWKIWGKVESLRNQYESTRHESTWQERQEIRQELERLRNKPEAERSRNPQTRVEEDGTLREYWKRNEEEMEAGVEIRERNEEERDRAVKRHRIAQKSTAQKSTAPKSIEDLEVPDMGVSQQEAPDLYEGMT
ncbi:DUF3723 domain protein [Fusarium austroafricanum]|uniref:DUF3723 domain protein n=1 Tax=Fusarium austroafricanum TaxID=2364996 RepID=A0A8H4KBN2_9HYPO|nr:DUF3723 domain protein [Fusarium austroafricanum]